MSGNLLWCDIETTGLRPGVDLVLEVALAITNSECDPLWEATHVVRRTEEELTRCDDFVLKMHSENSLLEECLGLKPPCGDGYATPADIAELGLAAMRIYGCIDTEFRGARYRSPLAGSTPSFDRGFLRAELPALEAQLSHRHIDVSTIEELVLRWYADVPRNTFSIHRAQPDIVRSYRRLTQLRSRYFASYNRVAEVSP